MTNFYPHFTQWGVSSVAILMDDIARTLEDRYKQEFSTIGRAQSHLVRTIKSQVETQLAKMQPDKKLTWMFCPTHYRGNEWENKYAMIIEVYIYQYTERGRKKRKRKSSIGKKSIEKYHLM